MKQAVRETVVRVANYESDWPSSNLLEFVHWLADKIDRIPEKCRANAEIEIEVEDPYEPNPSGIVGVTWSRTRSCWIARVFANNRTRTIGGYATSKEAVEARALYLAKKGK